MRARAGLDAALAPVMSAAIDSERLVFGARPSLSSRRRNRNSSAIVSFGNCCRSAVTVRVASGASAGEIDGAGPDEGSEGAGHDVFRIVGGPRSQRDHAPGMMSAMVDSLWHGFADMGSVVANGRFVVARERAPGSGIPTATSTSMRRRVCGSPTSGTAAPRSRRPSPTS